MSDEDKTTSEEVEETKPVKKDDKAKPAKKRRKTC